MTTVFFQYEESRYGGGTSPGQEGESWPDREPTYTERTYSPIAFLNPCNLWFDQVDTEIEFKHGDTVYLVDVRYSTGDTFGQDYGYHTLVDAFDNEVEADRLVASIYDGSYEGYKPWYGYFESLESADVLQFKIVDN